MVAPVVQLAKRGLNNNSRTEGWGPCGVDINKVMLSKDFLLRMDRLSLQGNHCASSRLLEVRRVNQIVQAHVAVHMSLHTHLYRFVTKEISSQKKD